MAKREKVYLMIRLSMLEQQYGKKIKKAENAGKIDLITNPVWRWGFFVTLIFFGIVGIGAVLNIDMVLNAIARDQTKNLIMVVLIAWLSVLGISIVLSFVVSVSRWHRMDALRNQYHKMLEQLERINEMDNGRRRTSGSYQDDGWEDARGASKRGRRSSEENLDYDHMKVLEFEDDDYSYYVEAVPKRGGRRR